jgi:hypothetical protein
MTKTNRKTETRIYRQPNTKAKRHDKDETKDRDKNT